MHLFSCRYIVQFHKMSTRLNDKAFFPKENIPNKELVGKEIPRQIDLLILV